MADAEVGDDAYGEDPTVRRLESLAAGLLGKEAALYVPSGTMANQLALRLLGRAGSEVLCGERAHVYRYEHAASAGNARVQLRPLPDADGTLDADDVARAAAGVQHHLPEISALFVENTHMPACGRPWRPAELDAVTGVRARPRVRRALRRRPHLERRHRARCVTGRAGRGHRHHDVLPVEGVERAGRLTAVRRAGARRRGPCRAIAPRRRHAPGGCDRGRRSRRAGDHGRAPGRRPRPARELADALAEVFPGSVDPAAVETNIVCAHAGALPVDLLDELASDGVRAGTIDPETVRFVTHHDVDDAGLARAVTSLRRIAARG